MPQHIAWLNGHFIDERNATVSIFDRGLLFGDGVYDVVTIIEGRLLDADLHLARLDRSCSAIALANPCSATEWIAILRELVRQTGVIEGLAYMQVTRGATERDFAFPNNVAPTAFAYARNKPILRHPNATGVAVITTPDLRWVRRDIKATSLLAPVLAKQHAREHGAFEAFMHDGGIITEGGSSNAFIVKNGVVITHPLGQAILAGVTRSVVLELAHGYGIAVQERAFSVAEALEADEAFLSSATTFVLPVIKLDGAQIGSGTPGPVAMRLRELYVQRALEIAAG